MTKSLLQRNSRLLISTCKLDIQYEPARSKASVWLPRKLLLKDSMQSEAAAASGWCHEQAVVHTKSLRAITSERVAPGDADAAEPRRRLERAAFRRQRRPSKTTLCQPTCPGVKTGTRSTA